MNPSKNSVKTFVRLSSAIVFMSMLGAAHATTNGATWSSASAATLPLLSGGSSTIAFTGGGGAATYDFSSSTDFGCAVLSSSASSLDYGVGSAWSATFTPGVPNLLLYILGWRGNSSGAASSTTYTFTSGGSPITPTIVSGVTGGSVAGNTLSIGDNSAGFYNGLLRFPGTISQLSVATNAIGTSVQVLTFGVSDSSCVTPTVSAPIDFSFNHKQPQTFASEIELK